MEERLLSLLESILGKSKKTSGDNYSFYSPFVDHYKRKLEINIRLNSKGENPWHCWISDEKGRTIKSLFKKLRVSKQTWDEYNSIFSKVNRYASEYETTEIVEHVELPKEFKPLYQKSDSIKWKHAMNYLLNRGVRAEDIVKYNIGYCEGGVYNKMIVIPSYSSEGKLNYFVARNFDSNSPVKYKNPPINKNIVPFELFVNWSSPLVLCEGPFDALAIKRNAIPLLGKHLQENLMKRIVTSTVKQIYIALDKDAMKDALRFAELLLNEGKEVYLVNLDEKDPSEMGFEHFTNLIQNTYPLTTYDLMAKKIELI